MIAAVAPPRRIDGPNASDFTLIVPGTGSFLDKMFAF